ncbi:Ger(x)C family spore germination protein [Clostridium formicaceticum]|uniref:Uncharacterized protein n=1 Tax=Clostridium formicaceticum TaxID=1497 RepID=A0AAC9WK48_9CLOT|nr:Ger(x)C family spore germination protein [Clostridium formicaceticum]AOY75169.1 hypothetical protein BJL90_04175 [Clostridium formicaceticum]ARE89595.1 hypothetical protein CLFO_40760 [Clostridium formicaceticum]
MKKVYVILLLTAGLLLKGCYNYNDINRMLFPTALLIDVDDEGNYIVSLEIFHAYRSNQDNTEQGQRILYQRQGRTFLDAISDFELIGAHPFNYTQNKVIIFTEKAAEVGLEGVIDYLHRHQEFLLRPYVMVYYGEPEKLLNVPLKQNEYLGLYLFDLLDRPLSRLTIEHRKLYELLNNRRMGINAALLTAIKMDEGHLEDKVRKDGAAVFHNDKLVGKLDVEDMVAIAFMNDKVRRGYIDVPYPESTEKFISLEIVKSNTITDILYEEGKVYLRQTINVKTVIAGSEEPLILDEAMVKAIQGNGEVVIQEKCHRLFNAYKKKGIDIFQVQEIFKRKYPRIDIDNVIEVAELEIQVNHHLQGSTNILDFKR